MYVGNTMCEQLPNQKSNGAVGSANTDVGGRGVAVVDKDVLGKVDARGSGVCYAGVVDWKIG